MTYHCINWVRHTLNKNNKTWRTLYDISLTITPISAVTAQHTIYMVDRRYRISSSACHNSPDSADNTALQWGHSADICSYNEGTVLTSVPTMRAQCWYLFLQWGHSADIWDAVEVAIDSTPLHVVILLAPCLPKPGIAHIIKEWVL